MEINSQQQLNLTARRNIYFISDAHLTFTNGYVENLLVSFLKSIKKDASHLYIVGDLFDFWLEYKNVIPAAFLKILSALLELTQNGVKVIYLPGNHDFWLGDYLHRQAGVMLADEKINISHQGKRIHLFHGDGLAYGDYGYRFIKKLFRAKPNIWLYKLLPVDLAYKIALRVSGTSRQYTSKMPKDLQGYYDYAAEKIKTGSDVVIMGHTHVPELINMGVGLYINTGDWIENFSYAVLKDGEFELKYYERKEN